MPKSHQISASEIHPTKF